MNDQSWEMELTDRLIIGLDSSTQSTKAIAWSRAGELVAEGRAEIPMGMPQAGYYEQDPVDWWAAACTALKSLFEQVDPARVDAIAISNQRETIGFFDRDLNPVRPAIVWLDTRSIAEIDQLSETLGADNLHRICGKPNDITPSHSSILWVTKNQPDVVKNLASVLDVATFLGGRLTGHQKVSWASADPSGVLDIEGHRWSDEILSALHLDASYFAEPVAPGTFIGAVTHLAAQQTGLRPGTKVFAGAGDGQCAGLGVNAAKEGRIYLNLGTAIITGLWSETTNISKSWRTMTSPTGEGYFLEGVMRAGTYFLDWMVENYITENSDTATHLHYQNESEQLPVGSEGLMVCPYLSGCMNPFWDSNAGAAIFGITPSHGHAHLYRASMEALTGEIARTIIDMQSKGLQADQIVAVGGGANSELWRKMLVDATGIPLMVSKSLEASSLGAAMIGAVGVGWFDGFEEAAQAMSTDGESYLPDTSAQDQWRSLLQKQQSLNAFCCHNEMLT